jgi:hypothetical protein
MMARSGSAKAATPATPRLTPTNVSISGGAIPTPKPVITITQQPSIAASIPTLTEPTPLTTEDAPATSSNNSSELSLLPSQQDQYNNLIETYGAVLALGGTSSEALTAVTASYNQTIQLSNTLGQQFYIPVVNAAWQQFQSLSSSQLAALGSNPAAVSNVVAGLEMSGASISQYQQALGITPNPSITLASLTGSVVNSGVAAGATSTAPLLNTPTNSIGTPQPTAPVTPPAYTAADDSSSDPTSASSGIDLSGPPIISATFPSTGATAPMSSATFPSTGATAPMSSATMIGIVVLVVILWMVME